MYLEKKNDKTIMEWIKNLWFQTHICTENLMKQA